MLFCSPHVFNPIYHFQPTGTIKNKVIAKELANRFVYQIQHVIAVILNLVFKV
jgi:hypothetical protein